jgi:hypothetical protein
MMNISKGNNTQDKSSIDLMFPIPIRSYETTFITYY